MNALIARLAAMLLCMAISTTAMAVIPESGLWWNPQEPGRGYTIELQDDGMFVAYYGYQADGSRSAFYTSYGTLNSRTGEMRGTWYTTENGQCFGCAHRSPRMIDLGEARLVFDSPVTGRIHLPDNIRIPIERMPLVGTHRHDPLALLGVWSIVEGSTLFFGEMLWFRRTTTDPANGFAGHRVGSANRVLLGSPTNNASLPAILVLVDSSTSYYTAYAFDSSINRWIGRSWTYPKTGQLSGAGLPAVAHRLIGNTHAQQSASVTSPAKSLSADTSEQLAESRDAERHHAGQLQPRSKSDAPDQVLIGEHWYDETALRAAFDDLLSQTRQP